MTSGVLAVAVFAAFLVLHNEKHPIADTEDRSLIDAMHESLAVKAAGLLIGLGSSMLGGYVAAGQAQHDKMLNGAASSVLYLLLGLLNFGHGLEARARTIQILLLLASPACGLLGAYVQTLRARGLAPARIP